MLNETPALLSTELLHTLSQMRRGEAIVLVNDAFSAASFEVRTLLHPAKSVLECLHAILPLFPLQSPDEPAMVMGAAARDLRSPPSVWRSYQALIRRHAFDVTLLAVEPDTFFHFCRSASLILRTRDATPDSCILLRKGSAR